MNHYTDYSVEDFVQDLRFRSWVKNPSPEEDAIWKEWIKANPHKADMLEEARAIILSVHPINTQSISDREIQHEIDGILGAIDAEERSKKKGGARMLWLKVAASLMVFLLVGWYSMEYGWGPEIDQPDVAVVVPENYMIERVNKSVDTLMISLPDNSSVLLSQNSLIRYPRAFAGDSRKVVLEGTAFFEVTKNPAKPFYVDVGKIMAKVLGTSFEISTDPTDGQVRVVVKSGAVSIYSNPEEYRDDPARAPNVILTRNEQAVFKDDVNQIRHTRLDSVSIQELKVPDTYLKFKGTPAEEVFQSLARVYGVTIDFSKADISECSVTASFTDEPFALKLDLICRSIGLTYDIANDQVTVIGDGCKN